MNPEHEYLRINKLLWNNRVENHVSSDFYDIKGFLNGKNTLNDIELSLLGDIRGKNVLHLQCHFGQDSISLSRMGAHVTGVDFSEMAIEKAKEFASQLNTTTEFICCDIYSLPENCKKKFDIVFTSYGTIGWLPDLESWAGVIAHFLKPSGAFVFAEFHPFVWMYDESLTFVKYPYFNRSAIVEIQSGSYAAASTGLLHQEISWNHTLSDVLTSLIQHGLSISEFHEYDYSPYNCFQNMEEKEKGHFQFKNLPGMLPLVYALKAINPN